MAMNIPKVGFRRFMKDGAQAFQGADEAVLRNIEACVELASQIRSSYGPNGMNKMVINHIEKLFVTNDAATILRELEVQHPAVKMLVEAAQMQEKQVGDNTNTVVILAAALLENAAQLMHMGLKPVEIAAGYEQACDEALAVLDELIVRDEKDLTNADVVKQLLRAAVSSKQYEHVDFVAELVAKACVTICPSNAANFNVDNLRVVKIAGGGVGACRVMNGMVFKRGVETARKRVEGGAKLAVFACPFDLTQTETKGTVLIENAQELLSFSKTEEGEVEAQVKAIADAGVSVVVAAGKFGDLYTHFLNQYNIMGVRLTSKFDLRRLCRATGAQAQARIGAPPASALGVCDDVFVDEIGDDRVVVFDKKSEHGHVATIVVRGSSDSRMDDVERAVDDAVNTFKALGKDGKLVAGGGAVEVELSRRVEEVGRKCTGLEQYAIKQFALALETLPRQLAENAGANTTKLMTQLYAAHEKPNGTSKGVDALNGGEMFDAAEANIYDLHSGKKSALRLATKAACTVLRVDQIIIAKQASGGPKPRAPGPQDADDDDGMA